MLTTPRALLRPLLMSLLISVATGGVSGCRGGQADPIRDAFNPYDADRRRRAVAAFTAASYGGDATYLRVYRLLVTDRDATVRAAAVKALGEHGTQDDAPVLVERLGDPDSFVRWQAARALQKIHHPPAAEPLIRVVREDEDADARAAAAYALGQYASPAVYDTLVEALTDPSFAVADSAHAALGMLTGQPLAADPDTWFRWGQDNRQSLFRHRQDYGYLPYVQPPGWFDRTLLRKKLRDPEPTSPVGPRASNTTDTDPS